MNMGATMTKDEGQVFEDAFRVLTKVIRGKVTPEIKNPITYNSTLASGEEGSIHQNFIYRGFGIILTGDKRGTKYRVIRLFKISPIGSTTLGYTAIADKVHPRYIDYHHFVERGLTLPEGVAILRDLAHELQTSLK